MRRHLGSSSRLVRVYAVTIVCREVLLAWGADVGERDAGRIHRGQVVFMADGGGRAPAIRKPISGAEAVARFLIGIARVGQSRGVIFEPVMVNGEHGLVARDRDRRVLSALTVHSEGAAIGMITNQLNPHKLRHLGDAGDSYALLKG